jgi:hypothetical protein
MVYLYDAWDQISNFCHQQLLRKMRRQISWTDGRTEGRTDGGRTDGGRTDGRRTNRGRTNGRTNRRTNERTNGRTDWRTNGRTEKRTEVKQYTPLPLRGAGVYLDMCCIVCFTMHSYIMASRFRLCRDSYFQAINHQWAYLLKLDTCQYMLIDWSLTFNGISFSVMWGSIFSIYQSPVSLLFLKSDTRQEIVFDWSIY